MQKRCNKRWKAAHNATIKVLEKLRRMEGSKQGMLAKFGKGLDQFKDLQYKFFFHYKFHYAKSQSTEHSQQQHQRKTQNTL